MKTIGEIYHQNKININGKTLQREAVRGIIVRNGKILLVCSKKSKDYKFPGGGIEDKETHHETLARELKEECGVSLVSTPVPYGVFVEYSKPHETDYDLFKMISYYYLCDINSDIFDTQKLDDYEAEQGFTPKWVTPVEALESNQQLLQTAPDHLPSWVQRETIVLNEIIKDSQLRISIGDIADTEKIVEFQAEHLSETEIKHCSREFFCPVGLRFAIKRKQVIVVHENDKIVAMARFYITKRYGHASLYQFAIAKQYRGKGLLLKMLDIINTGKIIYKCFLESSLNEYFLKTNWTLSSQDNNYKYWMTLK